MYASPDHLLEDVQLVLENKAKWYRWCLMDGRHLPAIRPEKMNIVRASADHFANALKYYYTPAADLSTDQRLHLRRYFMWRYTTDQSTPAPEYTAGGLKPRPNDPSPLKSFTATPEKPMALKFTTVFLLNGTDISKLPASEIYAAIEVEEQRIEKLKAIKNQPKMLKAEIAAAEAALATLVAHLDNN